MPSRFPAFLEIASRFHFQSTAAGKLAQPISFRLASSVVLARFLRLAARLHNFFWRLDLSLVRRRSTLRRLQTGQHVETGDETRAENYARNRPPRAREKVRDKVGAT